jgi:hypothetical protein
MRTLMQGARLDAMNQKHWSQINYRHPSWLQALVLTY